MRGTVVLVQKERFSRAYPIHQHTQIRTNGKPVFGHQHKRDHIACRDLKQLLSWEYFSFSFFWYFDRVASLSGYLHRVQLFPWQ